MKRLRKLMMLGMLMVAMYVFAGCGTTKVDLNKYVTISASGYDSLGTVSYYFDYEAFIRENNDSIKLKKGNAQFTNAALKEKKSGSEILVQYCIKSELDKYSGLSNGDVVTLKWNCDDEMAKKFFDCELVYSDITYKVSDLTEVKKFDAFEGVKVLYSGTSPNGSAELVVEDSRDAINDISFSIDKNSGLKNGDEVVVTVQYRNSESEFVRDYGSVLGEVEKKFVVDGLPKYITEITEVPEDMYGKMDKQLQDTITADFASWKDEDLLSIDLLGTYTLHPKEGMDFNAYNYVYFVYKIHAQNEESNGEFCYYWYGYYKNIMVLADGTCSVDLSDYTVPDSSEKIEFDDQRFVYYGFKDLDSLFNNEVVSKIENYEYTNNVTPQ